MIRRITLVILPIFLACFAKAAETKLDLAERIQAYVDRKDTVVFQYCKLNDCQEVGRKPLSEIKKLKSDSVKELGGMGGQTAIFAGESNASRPKELFVVGSSIVNNLHENLDRGVCADPNLKAKLKNAKSPKDFLISYDVKRCARLREWNGLSVRDEANHLRDGLKSIQ